MDGKSATLTADTTISAEEIALLHQKLDYLTEQFEAQSKRSEAWEELRRDMVPVMNSMTKLAIKELSEVGDDFELDDILHLAKRLLRDIRMFTGMLDQMESLVELGAEAKLMSKPVFDNLVTTLQTLEDKGYFIFAEGMMEITDRIVTAFGEDDLRALGDNIVTILTTVKNMTQPEIMELANSAINRIEEPLDENISTWALIKEMSDPEVRKGMARLLHVVKGLANQPDNVTSN